MHVYQDAAIRIRAGEQLYGGEVGTLDAYRYAPWFAYAWVPLTYLPQPMIDVVWSAFLLVGSAVAIRAVARPLTGSTLILLSLVAPILFGISAIGNVHGPMMALLLLGMPRRWGGIAVGIAASLKVVPILLVLVFIAQRRWTQLAAAVATAAALWLPIVWMDVDMVTLDPGAARSLPDVMWLPVAGLALGAAAVLAWRRSPNAALGAATAAILALPRLFVYEISLLLVALPKVKPAATIPFKDGVATRRSRIGVKALCEALGERNGGVLREIVGWTMGTSAIRSPKADRPFMQPQTRSSTADLRSGSPSAPR
jgi:hypothetical protein